MAETKFSGPVRSDNGFDMGSSSSPATSSVAGNKFLEFRAKTTATSGDNRLAYLRYEINGAGASGESLRSFTKLTAAADTVRGAHLSLDIDAGSASGLGVGVDSQILLGDAALTGGNYAVQNIEAYSAGDSVDVSGVTKFSMLRFSLGGDATGAANVDANATLFDFSGFTAGAGNMIDSTVTALTGKAGIPVTIDGVLYGYIPIVTGS